MAPKLPWSETVISLDSLEVGVDQLLVFYDPAGCRIETVQAAIDQMKLVDRAHGGHGKRNDAELLSELILVQWATVIPRWKSWLLKKLLRIE